MNSLDSTAQISKALAAAQKAFPLIPKNKEVTQQRKRKDGSIYEFAYSYAELAKIFELTLPILNKYEISVTQGVIEGANGFWVRTTLLHSSGEVITSDFPMLVSGDGMQAAGSSFTYARRYSYNGAIGLSPEDDLDENPTPGEKKKTAESPGGTSKPAGPKPKADPIGPGNFVPKVGKYAKIPLRKIGVSTLNSYFHFITQTAEQSNKPLEGAWLEMANAMELYLKDLEEKNADSNT